MLVEGYKLDEEQETAARTTAHNHLVVAGAGSGKTTTMIGHIKFLIENGIAKDSEILVLSFTHASANEMRARINKELADIDIKQTKSAIINHQKISHKTMQVNATTFHAFGFSILKNVDGKNLKVKVGNKNVDEKILDSTADDEIDFSDMILRATTYIVEKKYIDRKSTRLNSSH